MRWIVLAVVAWVAGSGTLVRGAIVEPVRVDGGLVEGVAGREAGVQVFKGVPYAAAPVGGLRWREPEGVAAWEGVRRADHFGEICPQAPYVPGSFYQLEFFQGAVPAMSEDCLYLNVWTAAGAGERRPVMVWIHGGGGVQGYGSEPCFDGEALARHGVVMVTFNYRLGIFGNFAHPELTAESAHHVSGNYAELDQIAALQWVQRNIAGFGGDPRNVTIFGQSSGGASINRLLVTPLAEGLFAKVIVESAAVLNSRDSKGTLAEMEKRGVACAADIGAHTLAEMRGRSAAELLAAAKTHKFDPNIDGYVLPELAVNVFERGGARAVPMMIGSNSDEGPYAAVTAEKFRADAEKRFGADAEEFLRLYPAGTDAEAYEAKHDARRDESFAGERWEARMQAKAEAPVYLYYFDRKPPGREREKYGAFHCAEIEYAFNTQWASDRPWEEVDRKLAEQVIGYWTNFAKTGDPNGVGLAEWPRYEAGKDEEMEIGEKVGARRVPNSDQLDFLERVLAREAK